VAFSPQIRRRARERAVQFLFGLEFTQYEWRTAIEDFWETNPSRPGVKRYAETLIRGIAEHQEELDAEIEKAVDNWKMERVGRIERSIIRLALYEMRHGEDVPRTVALNEAIEVAKKFGADDAPRFVNGVLDKL
jgi:transcription antitermination protein NusB